MAGNRKPARYGGPQDFGILPKISPDGRWVVYAVLGALGGALMVQSYPVPGAKWRVEAGGSHPRGRADGKEIFYLSGGQTTTRAVSVTPSHPRSPSSSTGRRC